ncbi:hypothetical protein [Cohnella mopanensis]|uniref:hypothetical protein n=1 Tax=Cohnella mopanensis TaxID=2911966 RepID=UPI001EF7F20E|nr:hypothetical protein [Cohnella mopanensis]
MEFEQELSSVLQQLRDKEIQESRAKQLRVFIMDKMSDDIISVINNLQGKFKLTKYDRSGTDAWSFEVNGHPVKLTRDELVYATIGGNPEDALLQSLVDNDYRDVIKNLIIEKLKANI